MSQQRLEDFSFAIRTDERERFIAARHLRLRGDQRIDRASLLFEVQLIDDIKPLQPRRDGMLDRRHLDLERPERIVPALRFVFAVMIPNSDRDLAQLRPIRLRRHRQREVVRTRIEMHEEHSAAVLHEVHERRPRGVAQRLRVMPVDVVRQQQVVVLRDVFLREVFDIERHIDLDARIAFQSRLHGRSGLLPVVPLVSVIARDQQHANRLVVDDRASRPFDTGQSLCDLGMSEVPRLNAVLRHIDFGRPSNRVEDQLAELVPFPVGVKVPTSRPEPAPAVRALLGPSDDIPIRCPTTKSRHNKQRTQSLNSLVLAVLFFSSES